MLADRVRIGTHSSKPAKLIDRTTPTLVVDQPYSTEGNGGRKLVRLDNGWLVACLVNPAGNIWYFVSKDSGETWEVLYMCAMGNNNMSIASVGNFVYGLIGTNSGNMWFKAIDVRTGQVTQNTNFISDKQVSYVSLVKNVDGTELHFCWSSKDVVSPNNYNIKYCKGTINSDGTIAFGDIEYVTRATGSIAHLLNPSIILDNNEVPCIIVQGDGMNSDANRGLGFNDSYRSILILKRNNSLNSGDKLDSSWSSKNIYVDRDARAQSTPSACVDKDGVIHVAWTGKNASGNFIINYAKSTDEGITWLTTMPIASMGENNLQPSICVNNKGILFIRHYRESGFSYKYKSEDCGGTWIYEGNIPYITNPSLLDDNTLDFEEPLMVSMSTDSHATYPNSIVFTGKWYE